MSLDLYQEEAQDRSDKSPLVQNPPASAFDNFAKGTGMATMRGFAKTGRAIDLLGSVGPIAQDHFTGGTEAQDKYFKEHNDVFQSAVDYWTPKPNEVGIAGEVVGGLISTLPTIMMSPALAVGSAQLDTAEDLARQGVSAPKAIAAGTAQAVGLGLGVWMPILGQNGWQRVVIGGAGFNAVQGIATRGLSEEILKGTPAEGQFKAFDPTSMTLDVLLGAAFGSLAHVSPAQRAQGAEAWAKIKEWGEKISPSQVDALATLRTAQHINVDSAPGKFESVQDIEAHVNRMRTALDQVVRDEPVEVSTMPEPIAKADPERMAESMKNVETLRASSENIIRDSEIFNIQWTHGTNAEGKESILKAGKFEPNVGSRNYEYSELGADTSYFSPKGGWWLDPERATNGRAQIYDASVEATLAKDANIFTLKSQDDLEKLASKVGLTGSEFLRKIFAEDLKAEVAVRGKSFDDFVKQQLEGKTPEEYVREVNKTFEEDGLAPPLNLEKEIDALKRTYENAMSVNSESRQVINNLLKAGVDGVYVTREFSESKNTGGGLAPEQLAMFNHEKIKPKVAEEAPAQSLTESKPTGENAKPDILATEAQRLVGEYGNQEITIGRNPDGTPITTTMKQFLDDTTMDVTHAQENAKLFEIAAGCYLGAK